MTRITAAEKLEKMMAAINAGRTVYVQTMTRATRISAKDVKRFDAIGRPLLKVSGESLFMSSGSRYDCIDFCTVSVG